MRSYGGTLLRYFWRDKIIFKLFKAKGIKLDLGKCKIGERSAKFLGHIVSKEGCKPDPQNVKAIEVMKPPKIQKKFEDFLECVGFIGNMFHILPKQPNPSRN